MTEKGKSGDMRPFGVMVCVACGVYEISLSTQPGGHGWQFLFGIAALVFGLLRGFYLLRAGKP